MEYLVGFYKIGEKKFFHIVVVLVLPHISPTNLRYKLPKYVFRLILWHPNKLSIATANESKQQLNSSIIYNLDSIARVNERKQRRKNGKFVKNLKNVHCRGSNSRRLSVPYVARSSNQLSHRDYWKHWTQKTV